MVGSSGLVERGAGTVVVAVLAGMVGAGSARWSGYQAVRVLVGAAVEGAAVARGTTIGLCPTTKAWSQGIIRETCRGRSSGMAENQVARAVAMVAVVVPTVPVVLRTTTAELELRPLGEE